MAERPRAPLQIELGPVEAREQRVQPFADGRLEIRSARGVAAVERLLIDSLGERLAGPTLVVCSGEGVIAWAVARLCPDAEVCLFDLDAWNRHRARELAARNGLEHVGTLVGPDLPEGPWETVLIPLAKHGDPHLAAELLRSAYTRLKPRGRLIVATDDRADRWLGQRVRETFGDATRLTPSRAGVVYIARKKAGGKEPRERNTRREFTARLFDRVVEVGTRPGVFAHGRVDDGTQTLADLTDLASLRVDCRVLDLGCGAGLVGIAAATARDDCHVLLVDSNARAVSVARDNIRRSGRRNALAVLAYDLDSVRARSFDLVLANPPHYGDWRILQAFTRDAARVLVPGGAYAVVTKAPDRAAEICREFFPRVEPREKRGYTVLRCTGAR